jgi:hypothetical protein
MSAPAICAMSFEDPICEARLQAHHIIPQQTLRKHGHGDKLGDRRNWVYLCRRHHRRHHSGHQRLPREALRQETLDFAEETGLSWYLDRHYPPTGGKEEEWQPERPKAST